VVTATNSVEFIPKIRTESVNAAIDFASIIVYACVDNSLAVIIQPTVDIIVRNTDRPVEMILISDAVRVIDIFEGGFDRSLKNPIGLIVIFERGF
jgi:hypothetical protein